MSKREKKRRDFKHKRNKQKKFEQVDELEQIEFVYVNMFGKSWNNIARFTSFKEADKRRNKILRKNGDTLDVKIKRMKKDDTYVVKTRRRCVVEEKYEQKQ